MVRSVNKKYQVWLAGYYDDFNGARAIPDDRNQPSDTTYSATKSHFGNPMNGEAFINPRFRFSVEERTQDSAKKVASTTNQYLQNDGIFEWLTFDDTRLSNDAWEGRAQLQYPDGHVANRYKFDNDSGYGSDFYQRFINGHNSNASYIVPTGDNDATFGHSDMKAYDDTNYNADNAGLHSTTGNFVQRAHLTGVFMGEKLQQNSSTTTPGEIFQEIHSPSKQPFLCIQAARKTDTDSNTTPSIIYDGHLNTRLDGDIFTARIALQSMISSGTWSDVGIHFEVGFPVAQAGILNDEGYTGTPAINFTLDLDDISYDTQALLGGGSYDTPQVTIDNAWLDIDFVFDYTNNKFKAYYNGTEITSTNSTAGSYSSGYTMSGGSATTASNLYGYQITVTNTGSSGTSGFVSYLMLDRVGLVRYLTDDISTTEEVHITELNIQQTVNGISTCQISIADDPDLTGGVRGAAATDYVLNLKNLFVASTPLDWNLLVFADSTSRIDRPVWKGEVSTFNIKEKRRNRIITLSAQDTMSYFDKQIPLWDVGQKGQNTSEDSTDYWSYDAHGFRNAMYLGADKLKILDGNVGFESDSSYAETADQRTQLGSGHPIQMYNNEDTYGPNSIEDDYEGYAIDGFVQKVGSTNTIAIMKDSSHGITTSVPSGGVNMQSTNHNGSGLTVSAVSGADVEFANTTLAYAPETAKIVYIGKYPNVPESERIDYYTATGTIQGDPYFDWITNVLNVAPSTNNWPAGTTVLNKLYVYFDADPNLEEGDTFYINRKNDGGSGNLTAAYNVKHTVNRIVKIRNYFGNTYGTGTYLATNLMYLWVVKTNTDYDGAENHGVYAANAYAPSDVLLVSSNRFSWSKDTGTISNVFGTNQETIKHRPIHARWMRDLSNSLWFKYHFGIVKRDPKDEPPPAPQTGHIAGTSNASYSRVSVSQTLSPTTTVIQVDETAYDAAPNAGVAEIWSTPNVSPAQYTNATEFKEKFIYKGKATTGSAWYLIGVQHIHGTYAIDSSYNYSENGTNKRIYLKFQDFEDDYKHIWLLWSDMRNNGNADADGSERKTDFGLQYPVNENYDFDLYFADQVDANGNIDKFGSLNVGEDLDVWNVDATTEPITGIPFSKPVDYNSKQAIALTDSGSKLRITTSETGTVAAGDYIYIINSTSHDGAHLVDSVSNDTYIHTTTTYVGNGEGTGGAYYCPTTEDALDVYHDWENKGGAFLIIDAAKFFNLNTHINGGKTGQDAGGRTDLQNYVVEGRSGFPALIDNYWTEALASYQTTGDITKENKNQNYLISSATLASIGFVDGLIGLPVNDASLFQDKGMGKLITVYQQNRNENPGDINYFAWDGKLETEVDGTIDTVSSETTVAAQAPYTGFSVVNIVTDDNTFETDGIKTGMVIERTNTSGTITYHNIYSVVGQKELQVVSDGSWATTDTVKIPQQLAKIYVIDGTHITESISQDLLNLESNLWEIYDAMAVDWSDLGINMSLGTTSGSETTPIAYEVHSTVYSAYMLRLMMHIDGFYESENGGTYWDSDKFRMLWNAAIMDTWLPSARINSMFDINNVPVTKMMTTYNDTSSNDSYGSIMDSRGKTLGALISSIQEKTGYGTTNSLHTSFSYLIGKDNRFEFRPKYNSGLVFNRDNIHIGSIRTNLTGQITNVRVYYNNGLSFVDWPSVSLGDTTRWNIVNHPEITSGDEALLVAKQEYDLRKTNPLELSITPILESDVEHKMIESGRYGYIADPYIALAGTNDTVANVCNWSILGTGGVLFPGMVNALDGNINVDIDPLETRYGSSKDTNAAGDVEWKHNYYWYGSNSISNAVQIVHIPNKTPLTNSNGHSMRMTVDLKNQTGTSIDEAEFVVTIADYNYSNDKDKTVSGATSSMVSTKDVKHSGFYEIDIPSTYGAVAGAKIVFSFNAEYCRALLRHRCGDPTQTAHGSADYILDSSVDNGSGSTNLHSIFPLGLRVYSEMGGGFRDARKWWYAPRIQICRDLSYTPATYVSVTDAGLELNSEPMVIQDILWKVPSGRAEEVSLVLERDESIATGGLISYLFPKHSPGRQSSSPVGGGGDDGSYQEPPVNGRPPVNDSDTLTDPSKQKPGGNTRDSTGTIYDASSGIGLGSLSGTTYGRLSGRMDLPNNDLSGDSKFSVLGQGKTGSTPSTKRGIEGMGVDIHVTGGSASVTADGYMFGGKGLLGVGDAVATSQETNIETTFTIPTDILSNRLTVQANITHSPSVGNTVSTTFTRGILYITVTIEETGETITNEVKVRTGIRNKTITLLSNKPITGLRNSGKKVKITITRKAGIGEDNADTTGITIHNLDVKMQRASAHTTSISNQFSPN